MRLSLVLGLVVLCLFIPEISSNQRKVRQNGGNKYFVIRSDGSPENEDDVQAIEDDPDSELSEMENKKPKETWYSPDKLEKLKDKFVLRPPKFTKNKKPKNKLPSTDPDKFQHLKDKFVLNPKYTKDKWSDPDKLQNLKDKFVVDPYSPKFTKSTEEKLPLIKTINYNTFDNHEPRKRVICLINYRDMQCLGQEYYYDQPNQKNRQMPPPDYDYRSRNADYEAPEEDDEYISK